MMNTKRMTFMLLWSVGISATAMAADIPATKTDEVAEEAKTLREKGAALFKKKEYASAVELFQKAIALERRAGVMAQMASALNQLGRYDEALRWYETTLQEFPSASAKLRKSVSDEMTDLVAKVGTITVEGDIISGARLFIDSREIGVLPLPAPVRVLAGVHEVREEIPGFAPLKTSVDVTAGQASVVQLIAKKREAKLEIREKHNWIVQVELDGQPIGLSPISRIVDAGEHRIRLRGYMRPDALLLCETPEQAVDMGARMESEEKTVKVGLFETQMVELSAEDMDASLHIDSTPPMAGLWIDGHDMGKTPWEGRLSLGEHTLEVRNKGFYVAKQSVTLERRKQRELAIVLEREPDRAAEERAARNAKIAVGLAFAAGGVGLGMFGVAGGLALRNRQVLQTKCGNAQSQCPSTEDGRVDEMRTLGNVSTVGLVITGVGAAAGTTLFFLMRPEERKGPKGPTLNVGLGLGGFLLDGRF